MKKRHQLGGKNQHPSSSVTPAPKPGQDSLGQNCLKRIRRSPGGNEMTVNISKQLLGMACIVAGAFIPPILSHPNLDAPRVRSRGEQPG